MPRLLFFVEEEDARYSADTLFERFDSNGPLGGKGRQKPHVSLLIGIRSNGIKNRDVAKWRYLLAPQGGSHQMRAVAISDVVLVPFRSGVARCVGELCVAVVVLDAPGHT